MFGLYLYTTSSCSLVPFQLFPAGDTTAAVLVVEMIAVRLPMVTAFGNVQHCGAEQGGNGPKQQKGRGGESTPEH